MDDLRFYRDMYFVLKDLYSKSLDMKQILIRMINEYEDQIEDLKREIEFLKLEEEA